MRKELQIRDVFDKASSTLKQRDAEGKTGLYPVYAAGGVIGCIDSYQQDKECVALVKDGSIGKLFLLPPKSSVIATIQYLLPKKGFDTKYLYYCLQSIDFTKYKQGAAIPHIYFRDYGNHRIVVDDSVEEQKKIVARLDLVYEKIQKVTNNNELALKQATAIYSSFLNQVMSPKEGWSKKSISDIIDSGSKVTYGIVQPGEHFEGGIPVVRPVDLGAKVISNNPLLKCTKKEISDKFKRTILNGKEILICVRGTTGVVSLSDDSLKGCNVTRGIVPFKIENEILRKFVYYWLQASIASSFIQKFTQGAALKQINIVDVKRIPVYLPPKEKMSSIVDSLEKLQQCIEKLNKNYDSIKSHCAALYKAVLEESFI